MITSGGAIIINKLKPKNYEHTDIGTHETVKAIRYAQGL
jgi:hypothetical protein